MGPHPLATLFDPTSIAVFGASDSASVGSQVFANLLAGGFEGDVVPINPKHSEVAGRRCPDRVSDVGRPIDLAVIATPATRVAKIIAECGKAGVRNAIILSAGFTETGAAGRRLQDEVTEAARRHGVRSLGPNCVGLVRPWNQMNASFLKVNPPPGNLALVSQSGALCSAIADWAGPNDVGLSALVSLGNAANIDFGDAIGFLARDPRTAAVLLYVEGVRDAASFVSALREAARIKPVVVLKAGRHAVSSAAVSTHTGAMVGGDEVFDAALERTGAVRAATIGQLFAAAEILAANKRAAGKRLCILTNGGGAGVLAADRAEDLRLHLEPPSPETVETLNRLLPPYWSHRNPVDILGDATPEVYAEALAACLKDPAYDGVLVLLTPQSMTDPSACAEAVVAAAEGARRKPLLACWMGETSVLEARRLMSAQHIPDFRTPERAVEAFSYLARHAVHQRLSLEMPKPCRDLREPDLQAARAAIARALDDGRTMLTDHESKGIMSAFGVPVITTEGAASPDEAAVVAERIGYPVALKIASPQISHKSDVDGVELNLGDADEVRAAYSMLMERVRARRPDAELRGVTVEAMARMTDGRELLVGVKRDPVFGPAILFGAGGTEVEVFRDSAVALPPLTSVLAERLIERTRVSKLLGEFRNLRPANRAAVVDVLLKVADMVAELPEIEELDINPLLAHPAGAVVIDARIHVRRAEPGAGPYSHMAIAPYPRHLVRHDRLPDGREIVIRPIRPEDAESEQAFVHKLSDESRRFRFQHALRVLTPEMLVRFTQIDYRREMAFLAVTPEEGGEVQHGVSRFVVQPDGESAEFAVVVSDDSRNIGIGTQLMTALLETARSWGLSLVEGDILSDNGPMLALVSELGFDLRVRPGERGVMHATLRV
ncbi:bifunctional acetate--CoA ligase family protein/GNAT family N-acetyltransferase [Roseitranquillus sediminis]|uniref:bifunctional acetate--CoA ligase family protein/GNAT family N-acetyltransferase n=1 Tax=Roseitranquillus sediminis TaxID=2809051 RepID=UPI001D0C233F|nr:bifunctional acetate--CoA ligase family protein/GNAT family N-acetyltransferase [Roseitranquillus sediminis]MBM9595730.1 bifunctional acetate--CoA ligase family protein/GNAT family N-acetyltransferase [Roseitranquillus sediminis]